MKKSLITILFLLSFSFLFAQNFIIKENFNSANDTVPPSGWTNRMVSGDTDVDKFQFTTKVFHFAEPLVKQYGVFDAYNGGSAGGTATNSQSEEVMLISPIVSTSGLSNLTLSIDKQVFIQTGGSAYIEVSINGGSSWSTVWSQTSSIVEGTPSNLKINLTTFKGYSSFRLRLRWNNTSTATYRGFFAFDNLQLYESKSIDTRVSDIVEMYDNSCPSATQPLDIIVYNAGTSTLSTIPVVLKIGTKTLYDTVYSLSPSSKKGAFGSQTFDASAGGAFPFVTYTNLSTDLVHANDTFKSVRNSSPPPAVPTGATIDQCGVGSATLTTNRNTGDSTYWFLQATGGNDVGAGNPFITPYIDKTTTFYVENSRITKNEISSSAGLYRFNTAAQGPGSMFDLTSKNEIIIDSLSQHFAYAGNYKMDVFYKNGTYKGSETNSSSWTKLDLVYDTLFVTGYGEFYVIRLKSPLRVPAGTTLGFYVDASTTSITFTNGSLNKENADVRIIGNTVLSANFNGVLTGYYWNGQVFFRKTCSTGRKAITVNVIPKPKGSKLIEGATFNGNFRSGTITGFDVASEGRKISYELQPPSAYSNSDFGTKWAITQLDMTSVNGTPIPTGDTTSNVPGTANGKLSYTPSKGWEDSTVVIRLLVWEATTNCDTLIERYIFIAPAPHPNFDGVNVCLGASIPFNNTTTLASGFNTYHWDFGDGTTSTFKSPIHTYTSYGKFKVKLTATSDYGIKSDTTIEIEVFEIPDVKFIVINACESNAVRFLNRTTISSGSLAFNWQLGDGNTSTASDPSHTYAAPGGYKVTLIASANGCSNSLTKFASQFPRPKSSFSAPDGCVGDKITFVNSSTIALGGKIGSQWLFGDGTRGTVTHPIKVYNTPGTKDVKLVSVSQFGCFDSITHSLVIKPSPLVDFEYDKSCDVDPVNFTNLTQEPTGANVIYTWDFGDGGSSTQKNPQYKFGKLGVNRVTLKAQSDNGCSQEITKDLLIQVQPVADFEVNNVCSGEPTHFLNLTKISAGEVSYKWFFGDGDSSDFNSPIKTYDVATTTVFVIKLEAKALGGCEDVVAKNVTIHEKPICGFTVVQSKLDRRTFTFVPDNASYGDNSYNWIMRGSGKYNETSPTHTFDYYDQEYNIILAIDGDNSCSCYDSTFVLNTSWPLGIGENQEGIGRAISPNPTTGMVTLRSDNEDVNNLKIKIYTSEGRLIELADVFEISGSIINLDLKHLSSGLYQVELVGNSLRTIHRLLITH